ncbi:MAG: hypothetical protein M1575_02980 [Patescibacteria group bacterium]|nr:hypothetical protein [Patescibacteria group bacterium]MCL5095669.1 hypothetical protein [Patescibacteria group bacterium]
MFVFGCLSPHPPLLLPNIGSPADRRKVKHTISALTSLAPKLEKAKPDIVIISSPHPDWGINVPLYFLNPNFQFLNSKQILMSNDQFLIKKLGQLFRNSDLEIKNSAILPILTTLNSPQKHYRYGQEIIKAIPPKLRLAWIASGDMSHRLKKDGPYGFHPSGPKFDQKFIELLKKKNTRGILNLDPELAEEAGECGLRSFCLLLGALEQEKINWQPEILSYEGPFGVGYLVAKLYD